MEFMKSVPVEVWVSLASIVATLVATYLRANGYSLPLLEKILDLVLVKKPGPQSAPTTVPIHVDASLVAGLPPIGQGGLIELARRILAQQQQQQGGAANADKQQSG